MKGRKPKYSPEEIAEMNQRLAAGESPSRLSKETGKPRTSILRFQDSARIPQELKAALLGSIDEKWTVSVWKRYRRVIDALLRRYEQIAPEATEKSLPDLTEGVVKLKSVLPAPRGQSRQAASQKSEETMLIFQARFKQSGSAPIEAAQVEESSGGVLGDPKGDSSESVSDGEPSGGPGQAGEANGAT